MYQRGQWFKWSPGSVLHSPKIAIGWGRERQLYPIFGLIIDIEYGSGMYTFASAYGYGDNDVRLVQTDRINIEEADALSNPLNERELFIYKMRYTKHFQHMETIYHQYSYVDGTS